MTGLGSVFALCLLALQQAGAKPATRPAEATKLEKIVAAELESLHEKGRFPGACVSFVLANGIQGAVAVGHADADTKEKLTVEHRLMSGSIGKTWVAALALQLVREGKVGLDAKVAQWFAREEWFARVPNAAALTMRMLLRHQSGIEEHVRDPAFAADVRAEPRREWKPAELVAYVLDKKPLFAPGKGWSYADTNYILAGMVLERVLGTTYYGAVKERLLAPLGLTDTVPSYRPKIDRLAQGHLAEHNPFGLPTRAQKDGEMIVNPQLEWTGGGFALTTKNLARWGNLLYSGKVTGPRLRDVMLDGVRTGRPGETYGLAVFSRTSKLGRVHGHSGWFPGYAAQLAFYPQYGLTVALQINSSDWGKLRAHPRLIADGIAAKLAAELLPVRR